MLYDDACLEVKAKYMTKGSDFVAIAGKYFYFFNEGVLIFKK